MKRLWLNIVLGGVLVLLSILSLRLASLNQRRMTEDGGASEKLFYNSAIIPSPTLISKTSVILTGDVMLGRKVAVQANKMDDPVYPFRKVADKLRKADIVFINLENPIITDCPPHETGFKFCAPPKMIEGLVYSGVDVVSLANNHSKNYGQAGLGETRKLLEERGILVTGLNNLAKKQIDSPLHEAASSAKVEDESVKQRRITFGFLGFDKSQQTQPKLDNDEVELVKSSSALVDVLIVGMHWGVEYQDKALPGVRNLAHELIKNGADVVVGHHPHWVQDVECFEISRGSDTNQPPRLIRLQPRDNICPLGSKPVYYSLGNFIFDQMWSGETKNGIVVELTFEGERLIDQKIHKTYIKNWGQVEFME